MSFMSEFRAFAVKGSVVDLAVGVIIGGALSTMVLAQIVAHMPTGAGRAVEAAFRNELAHPARKAAQADLGSSQRPGRIAARPHAGLNAFDERAERLRELADLIVRRQA